MFLKQLEQESEVTRKMLSIAPADKFDWQPHPKSMTLGKLATHIAELPGWITTAIETDGLDFAVNQRGSETISSHSGLMEFFEKELARGRASLQNATDADLLPNWTMRKGNYIISVRSKEEVVRMCVNQIIHHRAQLGVFLRLLNVPIPGSYGQSADELGM
ncbi:MAG: DinB family protein [Bacteroidota bacterium]